MVQSIASTCARAAISGTTPPNGAWASIWLSTTLDKISAEILSNVVLSQMEAHAPFGGVVPEIAARAHVDAMDWTIEAALNQARLRPDDLDAIAATAGPGLIGGV